MSFKKCEWLLFASKYFFYIRPYVRCLSKQLQKNILLKENLCTMDLIHMCTFISNFSGCGVSFDTIKYKTDILKVICSAMLTFAYSVK
jgi:hypothetical protein